MAERFEGAGERPVLEGYDLVVDGRDRRVLQVAAFDVAPGETHVVLGPNGAGKSTLLRVLSCLIPGEGRLVFGGRDVATAADRLALRRATASVFQQAYLLNTSVRGNVESGLRLRGVRGAQLRARAAAAMDLLGISHLADRGRVKLSGGESQRVSVARALAVDPQVVFFDEPMASLDPPTRRGLLRDLREIFSGGEMAAVWVTHDKDEALEVADRVSFLQEGAVVQSGTCLDVFSRPFNEGVASYLGLETYLEGVATAAGEGVARLTMAGGATILCTAGVEGPAIACVFPEDVVLFSTAPVEATSLRNIVAGTVNEITFAGRLRRVTVSCDGFTVAAVVTQAALDELGLVVGASVVAAFKASAVHLIPRPGAVRQDASGRQ